MITPYKKCEIKVKIRPPPKKAKVALKLPLFKIDNPKIENIPSTKTLNEKRIKLSIIESFNSKLFLNSATIIRLSITEVNVTIEIVLIPTSHLNPEFISHPAPNENNRNINQIVKW